MTAGSCLHLMMSVIAIAVTPILATLRTWTRRALLSFSTGMMGVLPGFHTLAVMSCHALLPCVAAAKMTCWITVLRPFRALLVVKASGHAPHVPQLHDIYPSE